MTRFFSIRPRTITPSVVAEQHLHRLVEVAERRRQAPDDEPRIPALQARERELHLHAALAAHQLVPLVDDHGVHAAELVVRALARQHQAQRLGRRDQRGRKAPVLLGALGRRGVAGADADRPRRGRARRAAPASPAPSRRRARASASARGRRAAARCAGAPRQPAHAERRGAGERAEPDGVGLAGAGGRVQQAALRPRPSPPRPRAGTRTGCQPRAANQASAGDSTLVVRRFDSARAAGDRPAPRHALTRLLGLRRS